MTHTAAISLRDWYRDGLLTDVLPFWLTHAIDAQEGGYFSCLDRSGTVFDTDKSIWVQGRFAWLLATVHSDLQTDDAYLTAAKSGLDFLHRHAADTDGKLFFTTTRDGQPLRRRRYYFSEAFAAQAHAAWSRAAGDQRAAAEAQSLFAQFLAENCPNDPPPKTTGIRPTRSIGKPMIGLGVAQVLRDCINPAGIDDVIDAFIAEIRDYFVKPELRAVMEQVAPDGSIIDHQDGRLLNPGHAIEGAWFILREARQRDDSELTALGVNMLDYMWERGWDAECGGIRYFADLHDKPVCEYWHDMKFWWPQCETLIATLLAWDLTGDERHWRRHQQLQQWVAARFPDPEHGEWFGYLHRDGRRSTDLKGNLWKGPFHIPRMQLICTRILTDKINNQQVSPDAQTPVHAC